VKSTLASGGDADPAGLAAVLLGGSGRRGGGVLLLDGRLARLQSATIAAALPFTLVIFLAFIGLIRAWSMETARRPGRRLRRNCRWKGRRALAHPAEADVLHAQT
jgi:choline/glycine/proline betaine transport protein